MNIQLNETISVEFDNATLEDAARWLCEIRSREQRCEDVLDALFVTLAFRQLEKKQPGTINRLIKACDTAKRK